MAETRPSSDAECVEDLYRRNEEMLPLATTGTSSESEMDRKGKRVTEEVVDDRDCSNGVKRNRTMTQLPPHPHPRRSSSSLRQNPVVMDLAPGFGLMSVSGRSRQMEDAVSVHPYFCRPALESRNALHFYSVYDGHGGPHVAMLCKEMMHVFLKEELMRESEQQQKQEEKERWSTVLKKSFARMDEMVLNTCACGCYRIKCGCVHTRYISDTIGSTAVVAVITPDQIVVANCGDSRAVLSRGGRAIPLSFDHKPDRPDELQRIEAMGGKVIEVKGPRVFGILAMSRALGDKYLKPTITSDPELIFTNRTYEDECLILASDGLWDVMSNQMACNVARGCLAEGRNASTNSESRFVGPPTEGNFTERVCQPASKCSLAATLLTRLALGRNSNDNISVIVVDLKYMFR